MGGLVIYFSEFRKRTIIFHYPKIREGMRSILSQWRGVTFMKTYGCLILKLGIKMLGKIERNCESWSRIQSKGSSFRFLKQLREGYSFIEWICVNFSPVNYHGDENWSLSFAATFKISNSLPLCGTIVLGENSKYESLFDSLHVEILFFFFILLTGIQYYILFIQL